MTRDLTGGWTPYVASTERGQFRNYLPNPEILQQQPSSHTVKGFRVNRRSFIQGAAAAGTVALALNAKARRAHAIEPVIISAMVAVGAYAIYTLGKIAVDHAAERKYPQRLMDWLFGKPGVNEALLYEDLFLPTNVTPVYGGSDPLARYHYRTGTPLPLMRPELRIRDVFSKKLNVVVGIDGVQRLFSNNAEELAHSYNQVKDTAVKENKELLDMLNSGASALKIPLNLRGSVRGVANDTLAEINHLYTRRDDFPFMPDEAEYTIPSVEDGTGDQYTGFGFKRNGKTTVAYLKNKYVR